ncbi:ABC transporter permease, partial [Massilia sp. YIM B02443]|uniref:ABC transporter permease n=1 Tax=Massilia sp. YIM B02443 TaxID=3050127 RepID=UPI0025B6E851|nr:ABC transporter permease [Massilia sp. YIM B02443]
MKFGLFKVRDFVVGWRLLLREPGYSAVTMLGLTVACAACYLLIGFVAWCMQYNSHVPHADRVYVVKQRVNHFPRPDWNTRAMLFLRDTALDSKMAEHASIADPIGKPLRVGDNLHKVEMFAVDRAFADIFGIVPLAGDLGAALGRPDGVALTQQTARRLFGDRPALNATVRSGDEVLQVLAILPDVPSNATQRWDALTGPLSRARPLAARVARPTDEQRGGVFVKLHPDQDKALLERLMQKALDESPLERRMGGERLVRALGRPGTEAALVALPSAYFDPDLGSGREAGRYGQKGPLMALGAVALLILALAMTNWINLVTVRTLRRQREIGMRKVLGAGAARVAGQFVAESVLVALVATIAGIVLAWLLLPPFAALVDRPLQGFFTPARLAVGLACGLLVGVVAGLYPAWTALRVRPAVVLAGRDSASETIGNLWLRRTLTVLQFGVAMALTAVTVAVGWQTWYASHADPGFDPAKLALIRVPESEDEQVRGLVRALARLPQIEGVTVQSEAVGRDDIRIIGGFSTRKGEDFRVELKDVSPAFFALYGMQPLAGRLFDAKRDQPGRGLVVLNMAAVQALGYPSAAAAIGQMPFAPDERAPDSVIIGVAPDLRYQSLRERPGPMIYRMTDVATVIAVRSALGQQALGRLLAPLWRQYYPNGIMQMQSAGSVFAENYTSDLRMAQMLGAASTVALALSAFGIYVLSAYTVQRGRREIVIRKLYG